VTVADLGRDALANGEYAIRTEAVLRQRFPDDVGAIARSAEILAGCAFTLDDLVYRYPAEDVPPGMTPDAYLRAVTYKGLAQRYGGEVPERVRTIVEKEFGIIADLRYETYFLTLYDVVRFARSRGILCQGRGSAGNSAVCYGLGITEVDPHRVNVLFERFISKERNEPPDIDVDFEHERREEVLQYIYQRYGRDRAAMVCEVIRYRGRSAVREVGKALGLSTDQIDAAASQFHPYGEKPTDPERFRDAGLDPDSRVVAHLVRLATEIQAFPRHLSIHVGGFVISATPIATLVPIENASMEGRTVIQWDKYSVEDLGLFKVDLLGLGALTHIRKALDLLRAHEGRDLDLATIPAEDRRTYDMISRGDTVGVFQIESRAQMSMLPRLRPVVFYDLVVQVAIVRPGPIQGGMVHPYLRRRQRIEAIDYPQSASERAAGHGESKVRSVLERTLGVPIFQEQVMKLVEVVAGFTPGQADELRRAMAAWKRKGGLEPFHDRIRDGMLANGYEESYFERIFEQIKGFGEYGFPESHSASFALLAYASSWLKCHYPAAFTCALLNSLPMGFYGPAQLIRDAQRHGVRVRPVDVTASAWDCSLEALATDADSAGGSHPAHALRLGFSRLSGFSEATAQRLVDAREAGAFRDIADLVHRAGLNAGERARLAELPRSIGQID
jgi:error-prone DNA polymerase